MKQIIIFLDGYYPVLNRLETSVGLIISFIVDNSGKGLENIFE